MNNYNLDASIKGLSEEEIIKLLDFEMPGDALKNDDCALINKYNLVSTDMLLEHYDFELRWASYSDIAYKAIAQNISDIYACAGVPKAMLLSLGLPKCVLIKDILEFSKGAKEAIQNLTPDLKIIGGDLSGSDLVIVSITVFGVCEKPVARNGASAGDIIQIAGTPGLASKGLDILQNNLPYNKDNLFINAFLRPNPPCILAKEASALIDISDGLIKDASRIAQSSGVSINLNKNLLQDFADISSFENVLYGGEDFCLLAAAPKLLKGFKKIGVCLNPKNIGISRPAVYLDGVLLKNSGFDHFQFDK